MNYIFENWEILLALIVFVFVILLAIKKKNLKEWLLFAVIKAEAELGSGTGIVKLRFVYDWAVERFKWISIVPFSLFSKWVENALVEMREILQENNAIKTIVENEE